MLTELILKTIEVSITSPLNFVITIDLLKTGLCEYGSEYGTCTLILGHNNMHNCSLSTLIYFVDFREQKLSNLLHEKKYLKAIGLAITLDRPFQVLNIIKGMFTVRLKLFLPQFV